MDELSPRDIVLHSCQTNAGHMVAMMYSLVLLLEMRDHFNKLKSKLEIIIMEKKMLDNCQHKYFLAVNNCKYLLEETYLQPF